MHGQILFLRRRAGNPDAGASSDGGGLSGSAAERAELDVGVDCGRSAHQRRFSVLAVRMKMKTKRPVERDNPIRRCFCFSAELILKLQSALDLIAAQAAGAHGHALRGAFNDHANLLRVRSPGAARLAVGVADVVAVNDALAADLTKLSHTLSHLLQGYIHIKTVKL